MDPNKIIYHNSNTRLIEFCDTGDLRHIKSMTLLGKKYSAQQVVDELLKEGKYTVQGNVENDPLRGLFMLRQMLEGHQMSSLDSEPLQMDCIISERTSDVLNITVYDNSTGSRKKFADIRLSNKPITINGLRGDGAIEYLDMHTYGSSLAIASSFGDLGLGVGLYLLCKLDGKWNVEDKAKAEEELAEKKVLLAAISKREQDLLLIDQQIAAKKAEFEEIISNLERKLKEQEKTLNELANDIRASEKEGQ